MPSLYVVIGPSVMLAALLSVVHLGTAVLWLILPVSAWAKAALTATVAWSLKRCMDGVALLRTPGAIVAISITNEEKIIAATRGGAWLECDLLPSSFVSYRLTILNLRARGTGREHHVVLCCGNVNTTDVRRLRIWLRWRLRAL